MPHNTTVWDIARIGNTAGIQLTAALHPDRLTTRMRNSVKRMVMSGLLIGAWQSHAKRLARALCDKYKIPYSQNTHSRVAVPPATPESLREQLVELLKADELAWRMAEGTLAAYWVAQYNEDRAALLCKRSDTCFVRFSDKHIGAEACSLLVAFVQQYSSDERKMVCAMLDGKDPIELNISHDY